MTCSYRRIRWTLLVLLVVSLLPGITRAQTDPDANRPPQVQTLSGRLAPEQFLKYLLPDLQAGDMLYLYATTTSGDLDPSLALAAGNAALDTATGLIDAVVAAAIETRRDPIALLREMAGDVFVAANDDGGTGYDAALAYEIPEDGLYTLFVGGSLQAETSGEFRLTVGLNAPDVLDGTARATGATIARIDQTEAQWPADVQEIPVMLDDQITQMTFPLRPFRQGETLQVRVESDADGAGETFGVTIALEDFSSKLLSVALPADGEAFTTLTYTFQQDVADYRVRLTGPPGGYRLLLGANAPVVLTGGAIEIGTPVLAQPTSVGVGVRIDQISNVDQRAENYEVVATLRLEWHDPARAFRPDTCQCTQQSFVGAGASGFVNADPALTWPDFFLFNQQGRRDTQNQGFFVESNGDVVFAERFTVTLQAPDFNFRRFPFDTQTFYVRVASIYTEQQYVFTPLEDYTGFGAQLGEEEWVVLDNEIIIETVNDAARFNLKFEARRHLNFYLFRILLPIFLIIVVSWITFFLKDYGKRVDVASANLLVFVAFNFTISGELPRLGYLTLMDSILISTFVVTALTIAFNVYLRRLQTLNREGLANRIDRIAIWMYPIGYAVFYAAAIVIFFG